MRIPVSKVYRAFPELDPFDDHQCELFVRQATSGSLRRRAAGMGVKAIGLTLGLALWAFLVTFGGVLVSGLRPGPAVASAMVLLGGVSLVLVPGLAVLSARDAWLRRTVKARLASARCPGCEYSMLGLPVVMGVAVCPECGEKLNLERMGLTPKDLIPPRGAAPTR